MSTLRYFDVDTWCMGVSLTFNTGEVIIRVFSFCLEPILSHVECKFVGDQPFPDI